ncbi:putative bifunctional diguanylate cyclase/phosphodiesterase [Histidinibacterium lentulum]|uniref:EAL domain-containing protein n=1 Tax=Histidinibacterium lentulum TaxID=2480588 RepID=A0A3N2QUU7_9RHOB|nr:EAL domain-containing protein [Histidinibacterium lentulum]ROT98998.1 EAL domain-containing protein [Histidinibacterium lentulum]
MSFMVISFLVLIAVTSATAALAWRLWCALREVRADLHGTRVDLVRQLREAEYFRMAAEHANDGIVIQEMDGRVVWPNPAYCRIMGLPRTEIVGRNPLTYAVPARDRPDEAAIRAFRYHPRDPSTQRLQLFRNVRSDGTEFWNQINISFRRDATGRENAILVCRDVTEQIEREERLHQATQELRIRATHDTMTGLANRTEMMRVASEALRQARTDGTRLGMLHIDLDKFKEINDTHGHAAGDSMLVHVARLLKDGVRADDLVARIGGDEFVVICPGLRTLDDLRGIAGGLVANARRPLAWNDRQLPVGASVGAALSGPETRDADMLLQQADFALYEAKRRGRGRVAVYDETLHERQMAEQRRALELREAIEFGELECHFQPKLDLVTGRVTGFETLMRWRHPTEGLMSPGSFLDLVGDLGLLAAADLGSMGMALDLKSRLDAAGHSGLGIAFNASTELLTHPDFVPRLVHGVEGRRIPRADITIEVLETTMLGALTADSPQGRVIGDLATAGFNVVLDDFGTGHAGLAHLAWMPVTGVKIDRTLVAGLLTDTTSAKITRAIIDLCHDLGLGVVAEGVESAEAAACLRAMGCPTIQGFWLSRPLAEADVFAWLDARDPLLQTGTG